MFTFSTKKDFKAHKYTLVHLVTYRSDVELDALDIEKAGGIIDKIDKQEDDWVTNDYIIFHCNSKEKFLSVGEKTDVIYLPDEVRKFESPKYDVGDKINGVTIESFCFSDGYFGYLLSIGDKYVFVKEDDISWEIANKSISELEDEALDGLGKIDREEMKKSIVDLVTTQIFSWKKPWSPVMNGGYFTKVKGKVVQGVVNGYTMRNYTANAFSLLVYCNAFNEVFKTEYSPIFVSKNLLSRNKWDLIERDTKKFSPTSIIYEAFWFKIKDEEEIKRIMQFEEETGHLPFGVIKKGEDYLRRGSKMEEVVLAENIVGNPLNVERIKAPEAEMIDYVDNVVEAMSKNICKVYNDQVDRCYYVPSKDEIHLVPAIGFKAINEYYSTRFHESTHSTLHKSRLNRDFGSKTWGDDGYAMEELVAEIGSYMLCCDLGINYYRKDKSTPFSTKDNSMAYIASWLKKAKNLYGGDEEKTIVAAFDYADRAVSWILKDIDLDALIPESIKELEDKEYSDITIFENDDLKVVNVRSDDRIRLFFKKIPSEKIREELKTEKFNYAKSFKAWQVINDEEGKKKVDAFLKNHYKKDNNTLALAKAKMKMAKAKMKLMNFK